MTLPVRLDEDGAAAPPRENGELAFSAPWESRLFGLTMALVEAGRLDWEEFRGRLIVRIAAWEKRAPSAGESWNYWQRWREAFEDSLEAAGLVNQPELDDLTRRLAARPHGHDHHNDHHHHHHEEHAAHAVEETDQ
ncbi:MAG: nitrile hydratase accessory protein [Holophagales bacterium]|nr:nitrile hydratase accessory protein [Holophagales bacterium]MYF96549.1 nitrile hydratase accessory protein [Holophagales bacterium]